MKLPAYSALALATLCLGTSAQTPTISSHFDTGVEGWEVVGFNASGHLPAYPGTAPTWSLQGHPGGCLEAFDDYYDTAVSAPAAYLGDRREYLGGTLSFDVFEWETTSSWDQPAAMLVGANHTLFYPAAAPTQNIWLHMSLPLTPELWRFDSKYGPVVTGAQMLEVLSDLQALWITTEYRGGIDDTFVDNVELAPPLHGSVAIIGSGANPAGSLSVLSGGAQLGTTLTLGVDNPLGTQALGSLPFLAVSLAPLAPFPDGVSLPGLGMSSSSAPGQLYINVGLLVAPLVPGAPWAGPLTPAAMPLNLPSDPALAGLVLYVQGALLDTTPQGWLALTDGAMLVLGT